uniref:Uncharacterized protein n=1 Tax=Quercus lobata TaxID=97700 RepID=A0A7N2LAX3_QUELO
MLSITMVALIKLFFKFHIKFPHQNLRSEISYHLESAFYWDGIGFVLEEQLIGGVCIEVKKLQPDLYDESPGSSDYSTGSTLQLHSAANKLEQAHAEICSLHQDTGTGSESIHIEEQKDVGECESGVISGATPKQGIFMCCDEQPNNDGVVCVSSSTDFGSPLQVTPLFRS